MSKRLLFVINPYAGKGLIKNNLLDLVDIFTKADYEVTVYPTQYSRDAARIVKEKIAECDLIVCSGGDGTLDEVVTGMITSGIKRTIGYIPAGSTNDFANSLQLSSDMTEAANSIVNGKKFACDIGKFNQGVFVYIAAFGLFTEVSYETPQTMKNWLGHTAYMLEGVKQLSNIKSYALRIEHDGEVIEDEFMYGMITNSCSVGGFKKLTGPNVELSDGLFEVRLIKKPRNPIEFNSLLSAVLIEDIDSELMYCFKTYELTIISTEDEEIAWTLDGEFGGNHKKAVLKNERQILEIMIDADADIK